MKIAEMGQQNGSFDFHRPILHKFPIRADTNTAFKSEAVKGLRDRIAPDEAKTAEHHVVLTSAGSTCFHAKAGKLARSAIRPLKFKAWCFEFGRKTEEAEWSEFRLTRSRASAKYGTILAARR